MENSGRLENLIENVLLPLPLPQEALILNGEKRRIPDFGLIFHHLPGFTDFLEINATASGKDGKYFFQLVNGSSLLIHIEDFMIVEIGIVSLDGNVNSRKAPEPETNSDIIDMWKKGMVKKGH